MDDKKLHITNDELDLDLVFPFYFMLDKSLIITETGKGLKKILPLLKGSSFQNSFKLKRPFSPKYHFDSLLEYSRQIFIIESLETNILFRGQIIYVAHKQSIMFIGSPWFTNVDDMEKKGIFITDFALHDTTPDMLQVIKTQEIVTNDVKALVNELSSQQKEITESENRLLLQYSISQVLATYTTIQDAMCKVIEIICNTIGWKCGVFYMPDEVTVALQHVSYWQHSTILGTVFENANRNISFLKGVGLPGRVWKTNEFLWIPDLTKYDNALRATVLAQSNLRGAFGFPISINNAVAGIMEFFSDEVMETDTTLRRMFVATGNQIAQFIENDRANIIIQESEKQYKQLVEEASDMIYRTNYKGLLVYVNPIAERVMKMAEKEIIGKHFTHLIRNDYREKAMHFYKQQFTNKTPVTYFEFPAVYGQTEEVWIGQNAKIIFDGNKIAGFHVVARDITDRKKEEHFRKVLQEKYQNIIANMNLGLLEVDNDDIIQYANQSYADISGYEISELLGKNVLEIFSFSKNFDILKSKNQLRKQGKSDMYQIEIKNKRGESRWWAISGAPNYDDKGNLLGTIGIHLDITDQKNTEQKLKQAIITAENSKKIKEQFLANMSHEIRTPMNAIIGMADILQENNLSVEQKECVDAIKLSGDNLLTIINDILDFSKIESGKVAFENTPFKLEDIVVGIIQTLHFTSLKTSVSLSYLISKDIPKIITGDAVRLRQILLNLASNSIKFTEKGSVIIDIQLKNKNEDSYTLLFNVTDTGIGIPENKLLSIFESFTQASNETTRKFGGTGLGLTIAKQLVELQGGSISVNSEIGKGSCFSFTLTFGKGDQEDIQINADETTISYSELQDIHILLAEDNLMNQLLAKKIFKKWNCKFDIADNGKIAVDKLLQTDYDIILMDMQMPEMDGYDATKYIRNNLPSPKSTIPIIAITAHAMVGEKEKCLALGMNDYISKPFNQRVLYEKIKELTVKK
jgi:PAS domain S-box-containing protein